MSTGIQDKVVVVTGGASGIGRATSLAFAREGAGVAVWLCSDEASFVNGQVISVDGGLDLA